MRRFAFLGALLLSLALAAPVQAASPSTWVATVKVGGFAGTVTVTAATSTTSARLAADLTGLTSQTMASLSVYGGPVGTDVHLVVRTRWIGRFAGGRWHVSVALTPQMAAWLPFEVAHRGGLHVTLVQAGHTTSALLTGK